MTAELMPSTVHRRRRFILPVLGLVLVVLLGGLAWAGWQLLQGRRALQQGAAELQAVRSGLQRGDELLSRLEAAGADTQAARSHLDDPLVRGLGELPGLGRPVRTARAVAASADSAVRDALLPLARAAGDQPAQRLFHDGAIDLTYLSELAGPSAIATEALREASFTLSQSPARSGVGQIDGARTQLAKGLTELRSVVEQLALGTRVAPDLLGVDAPQRYLVVAQNPAESRGTGGLVGGYVLLEADAGILRAVSTGKNTDLSAFASGTSVADLGQEFTDHYGGYLPTVAWVNSNASPHFPYAATIWRELWRKQTGQDLAGVLAVDPIALSHLMKATGPVTLADGTAATAANVVDLTLRDNYLRFQGPDQTARKDYLQEISRGVATGLSTGTPNARLLLEGLTRSAREGRLKFWAADPAVEEQILDTPLAGRLPEGRAAVGDVVFNLSGSKLDYYLHRTLSYSPGCAGAPSTLSLTLRNTAPTSGLPDYVTPAAPRAGKPAGTNRSLVTLYLPPQSELLQASLGDQAITPRQGNELGLRWAEQIIALEPGEATTLRLSFKERLGATPDVQRISQPLVQPERFTVTDCGRSPITPAG